MHKWRTGRIKDCLTALGIFFLVVAASLACNAGPRTAQDTAPAEAVPSPAAGNSNGASPGDASAQQLSSPDGAGQLSLAMPGVLPSLSGVIDKVKPVVVTVSVEAVSEGLFFDFADEGTGSGIIVRPDGYIATNYHVVQNTREVTVTLPDGTNLGATLVGRDLLTDLAVLKVDAKDLPVATFGDSDALKVGDWVLAVGNALALKGGPTVTLGIISARGRTANTERGRLYDLIQTDAAINEGSSGGPLVNLGGEVVGINTAILRRAQGIGFSISSASAGPIIESLIENGRVVRPLIGLVGDDVTPARANVLDLQGTEGVIVTQASEDGPAYKAGIRQGDVITKLNGVPTPDMATFLTLLWTYRVGQVIQVEYVSGDQTLVASVKLEERLLD